MTGQVGTTKAEKIDITPQMVEAGGSISYDLVSVGGLEVSRAFLVSEVFQVMAAASDCRIAPKDD